MRHRFRRVIRALVYHISRPFRLEVHVRPEADLADRTVFAEEIVKVWASYVEISGKRQGSRWGDGRLTDFSRYEQDTINQ